MKKNIVFVALAAFAAFLAEGAMPVTQREATSIVESVIKAEVRVASTPIPEAKTNLLTYVRAKAHPVTGEVRDEDEDGSVVIGKDASGTISSNFIAGVTARTQLRSEAIAIGHNATVLDGSSEATVQGIAIGWNAKAIGSNALAIGSGAKHWYETDEGGDRTYANGSETVAFGYCARATATRAVQIGDGINTVPESLKFRDVWIVRGGHLAVEVGTNDVIGIATEYFRPQVLTNRCENTIRSHTLATFDPREPVDDEMGVTPTGTRNYEICLPNTDNVRSGLPISIDTDFDGAVRLGAWWTNRIVRLPALVRVREPVPKTCILSVETYDDGHDWTPVVTGAVETNGCVEVCGTNLHLVAGAEFGGSRISVRNPLYARVRVQTNGVAGTTGWLLDAQGGRLAEFTVE